jgi:hypothetical protein
MKPLIKSALNPYAAPYVKGKGLGRRKKTSSWDNFRFIWIKNKKGTWKAAGEKWRSLTKDQQACWTNHNNALIAGLPGI